MPVPIQATPYLYFPVPKVACTSVKMGILRHNDPQAFNTISASDDRRKYNVHTVYPSYQFKPWIARLKWPRRQWICVVRDPIKRAVSGYRNRILFHKDLEKIPAEELTQNGLAPNPDLNSFASNLQKYCDVSMAVHHHFAPHCFYLGTKPELYKRIFKLSEIDDLTALVATSGVALEIPHEQTGGPKVSISDLSKEGHDALYAFYAEDYNHWGNHFDR